MAEGKKKEEENTTELLDQIKSDTQLVEFMRPQIDKAVSAAKLKLESTLEDRVTAGINAAKEAEKAAAAAKEGNLDPMIAANDAKVAELTAQLDSMRATQEKADLNASISKMLNEKGLGDLDGVLVHSATTLEDYTAAADIFDAKVKAQVEAQVKERLGTSPNLQGGKEKDPGDLVTQLLKARKDGDQAKVLELNGAIQELRSNGG